MNNFLSVLVESGWVTLIGLFIVFLGLIILVLCIFAMNALFQERKSKKAEPESVPAPAPAPAPVPTAPAPVVEEGIAP